jgi:hypothetical protein
MSRPGHSKKLRLPCFYDGWTHMQLFAHLVKAGPKMHGPPGPPKPKKGGKG